MVFTIEAPVSNLQWLSSLNVEELPNSNFRRSSIIGTIGPKTNGVEVLVKLRQAGLNIVRMNFSHGSYEYHQSVIDNARESEKVYSGRPLAIALDTKGPEIRTGLTVDGGDHPIEANHEMIFTTDEAYAEKCDASIMYIDYKNIAKVIQPGRVIYVDDGVLSFEVLEIVNEKTLRVRAINAGRISSKKGVNLPNTDVDLPALSEKDKADLRFGVKNGVHMVFASFIRSGDDIRSIREVLGEDGKEIQIIAKIENQQGVNNFDSILKETDGVMVARGDLGIEIPASQVFIVQKQLIAKCNLAGKPVICATQMLESMTYNPRPTRAEVSDVGNAILDGADCVMLSGETAKGNYPIEAVTMMRETALQAEKAIAYQPLFNEIRALTSRPTETSETIAISAVSASFEQQAKAIIVLSTSGTTSRLLSKYRPNCPILMVTRNRNAACYSHLYRGVYPFVYNKPKANDAAQWQQDVEERLKWGMDQAVELGILNKGDVVVAIQGWTGGLGHTNTIRVLECV
ncbi:pyruvate kinase [Nadsonia fulvescens var. elongata DSM 6958]|uniref:Pyruvate kinase n=1 Tax=Nadsonia fulvescens var. elongata DSM 6958 TaxID=857566 RepID=A0A1E3PFV9_9ASCO|nr:pyruvate kinase [Nadsonia fulvescens var. elongata DSM 6958]